MLYKELAKLYEELDNTSKRLEKTFLISEFLKKTKEIEIDAVLSLMNGKIFSRNEEKTTGISSKLIIKALTKTTGIKNIEDYWKRLGDLGNVAEEVLKKRKQVTLVQKELTILEVFEKLRLLETFEGKGSVDHKLDLISKLLLHSDPAESKYLIRSIADNMRIGVGLSSIRDAITWAYIVDVEYDKEKNDIIFQNNNREEYTKIIERIQTALDVLNNLSELALILKKEGLRGLEKVKIAIGRPINVMLYQKAKDVEDAFSIVGRPAAFEVKYDGFRIQAHVSNEVKIFTRMLDEVTKQFPDVVSALKENVKAECILDCEVVGYDKETKKYLPFQKITQRIKRKFNIDDMAESFPVELNVFDIIYHDGKSIINEPFKKRRETLKSIIDEKEKKIVLAKQIITSDAIEAKAFYDISLKLGEEGCMAKNLEGIYKPGSRTGFGVKIKSILDPLDLVIVAAEYGEGKRSGLLSSFYLACSDDGELREIGKVSTGLKELEGDGTTFEELTRLLLPTITKTEGKIVFVKPKIVIEVGYEEIQASTSYDSGYALRFPRFLRLRNDEKTVEDISTMQDVIEQYRTQRGRSR